jgi:hypothetical protein
MIEQLAKAVIEQQFSAEIAMSGLVFTPVNYELPENTHFLADYKLPCPSLVLVRRTAGKEEAWKLLADTWQLVHESAKLNSYVAAEVKAFLGNQEPRKGSGNLVLPSAGDHR